MKQRHTQQLNAQFQTKWVKKKKSFAPKLFYFFLCLDIIYSEEITNCNLMTSSVILTFHRVWLLKSCWANYVVTLYEKHLRKYQTNATFLIAKNCARFAVIHHETNLFSLCYGYSIQIFIFRAIHFEHRKQPAVMTRLKIQYTISHRLTGMQCACAHSFGKCLMKVSIVLRTIT